MSSTYLIAVSETVIKANRKSFKHARSKAKGAAFAWDNVKGKNCEKFEPRGKAYKRVMQIERESSYFRLKITLEDHLQKLVDNWW